MSLPNRPGYTRRALVALSAVAISSAVIAVGPPAGSVASSKAPLVATASPSATAYLDGFSGPRPVVARDLGGSWAFQPLSRTTCQYDAGQGPKPGCTTVPVTEESTTILVPGGGWVKQGFTDVSEALYSRNIRIPDTGHSQVTRLRFGAVNHQADVYIRPAGAPAESLGELVGTSITSFTPAAFELTPFVRR